LEYEDIRKKLLEFQDDHKGHIRKLASMVQQLGGKPLKPSPDLKGYLIEGYTALKSVTGTKGALEVMRTNEILTNRKYGEAAALDFPEEVMKMIRSNFTHEQLHLQYIEEILSTPRREL